MPFRRPAPAMICVLCAVLPACGLLPRRPEPLSGMRRVAVAPVLVNGMVDKDLAARVEPLAQALANELARLESVQVIRPTEVLAAMKEFGLAMDSGDHALAVARALKADAILVAEVTDFAAFPPPRISVAVQLYSTRADKYAWTGDYIAMEQWGRPFKIEGSMERQARVSMERVVDLADARTRDELEDFAGDRAERPLGSSAYVLVNQGFLRFASHQLVAEVIRLDAARVEEDARAGQGDGAREEATMPAAYKP